MNRPAPASVGEEEDFISLAPLWSLLRRYRRWLEVSLFGLFLAAAGGLAAAWLVLPHRTVSSVGISLKFPGAALGQYPNKTPFLPTDLLLPEVLRKVYESNRLEKYVRFDDFKTSLAIEPGGERLMSLEKEYMVKMDDRKLTAAERQRLEDEFKQRRAALERVDFDLSWRQNGRAARLVPSEIQAKVLEDIPRQWAEDAASNKRVLLFAANLPSRITSENSEEKIISNSIDVGERIRALSRGLAELIQFPGSAHVALADGTSLVDLKIRLQVLREDGLNKVRGALLAFSQSPAEKIRLQELLQARFRARQKVLLLEKGRLQPQEDAYRDYLASRPGAEIGRAAPNRSLAAAGPTLQISDAFLGKWMEMTKSTADEVYRQELVDRMVMGRERVLDAEANLQEIQSYLRDFETPANQEKDRPRVVGSADSQAQALSLSHGDRAKALQAMQEAATELNALVVAADQLRTLLAKNYQLPQVSLYETRSPFQLQGTSSLSLRNAGLLLVAYVVLGLGATLFACWVHDQSSKPQA